MLTNQAPSLDNAAYMQLRERNISKEFFSDENTYTECVRKLVKFKDGAIFLCHKF